MKKIPLCYHPSTVVILDDDNNYLKQLAFSFIKIPFIVQTYTSSHKLLDFINKKYVPSYWSARFINQGNDIEHNYQQWTLNIDLYSLPLEIYNQDRFKQISCVISDYSMPGQNGLEILQQIVHPFIKKILLTGIADEHIAIEAFNNGLIDAFIRKSDIDMQQKLFDAVCTLSNKYFTELSEVGLNIILTNKHLSSVLVEAHFYDLFYNQIRKYGIVEYYLFENFGCYIMLDKYGKAYGFFVYPEHDVQEVLSDLNIVNSWQEFFTNEPKIMCFHRMTIPKFPTDQEKVEYILPAQQFIGIRGNYYWAITDQNLDIITEHVLSYTKFIDKQQMNL